MAVAIGAVGTLAAAATQTVSPAYPASIAAGDGLLLVRAAKPDTTVLVTPDGWALLDEQTGGAGVFGNDTGPLKICVYWREADGTETGTLVCTTDLGTFDIQQAVINRYTKADGTDWDVTAGGGADNVAGNDWTVTSDDPLGLEAGDVVQVALSWPTDSVRTWSDEALSASGATIGALAVPLVAAGTGLGADMASRLHAFVCTAGSSDVGPTYVGTVNSATNVTGPTTMVRLREVSGDGPVEVALTPAVMVFSAPTVVAAPGMVSVSLTPAAVGLSAPSVPATPGVVAVPLASATVTLTALPVDPAPGLVTVALTCATVAIAAGSVAVRSETVAARGTIRVPAGSSIRTPARSGVRIR